MRFEARNLLSNKSSGVFAEMFRYAFVSVAALIVDAGGLILLKEVFHMNVILAASISFTAGLIVNFIMSRQWAFSQAAQVGKYREFIIFAVIGLTGLLLTDCIIWLVNSYGHQNYLLAKAVAVIIVFFWNFILRRFLIYREKGESDATN